MNSKVLDFGILCLSVGAIGYVVAATVINHLTKSALS